MKKQLNKWQVVLQTGPLIEYNYFGWHRTVFGVLRLKSFPEQGIRLSKANYQGFLLQWRWWFPMERDR